MPSSRSARPSDFEWRATIAYFCAMVYIVLWGWHAQCEIVFAISNAVAPSAKQVRATMPAAYGFHVLGNSSLWAPGVMNRTDWNVSSPTYGKWIPPPGNQLLASTQSPPGEGPPVQRGYDGTQLTCV